MHRNKYLTTIIALAGLMLVGMSAPSARAMELLDAYFRTDLAFPGYVQFWENTAVNSGASGGFVHVFVRNQGGEPVKFEDASMEGISLKQAVAFSDQRKFRKRAFAASLYFSAISQEQKDKLIAAGEPVWYRFEPQTLAPGECGELTVRLRGKPAGDSVKFVLSWAGGAKLEAAVSPKSSPPRFEGITFSFGRDKAYLYVAKSASGKPPSRILMDGTDITSASTIGSEPVGTVYPIVCKLKSPLARGAFHCFQVSYPDGDKVTAATRVWDDGFAYGMWGAAPSKSNDKALAESYIRDLALHSINVQMEQVGSEAVRAYMTTEEGQKLMESLGIRRMVSDIGKGGAKNPWAYFLMDEPDAGDSKVKGIPGNKLVGSLGQGLVERSLEIRQVDPITAQLLNVDMTYKPQNWYTYAQLPDLLTADPYYQNRLAESWSKPEKVEIYKKAEWVAAVAEVCRSAQAPKMLDLVIFTGRAEKDSKKFRFATPQEKRMEAYYAIGSGCKGISYWWFHSLAQGLPPKNADPMAVAQWREIGLVGAELGTLGPVIMTSCPVDVPVKTSAKLWTRTLMRGDDTLVLVCVNDDHVNDDKGTKINTVERPEISVELPHRWLPVSIFEVGTQGTAELRFGESSVDTTSLSTHLTLSLDKVDVTRAIVITRDPDLRGRLQKLYDSDYAAKVSKLLGS